MVVVVELVVVVVVVQAVEVLAMEVVGMEETLQFLKMTNICRLFFTRFHHIKE